MESLVSVYIDPVLLELAFACDIFDGLGRIRYRSNSGVELGLPTRVLLKKILLLLLSIFGTSFA